MNRGFLFIAFFLMMFVGQLPQLYAADQEYVINWPMNEGTGNIAFDISGNSNHGVLSNGANFETANFAFGGGDVDFDGGNDIIQTAIVPEETNMTISVWFKPDDTDQDTIWIMYNSNESVVWELTMDSNTDGNREFRYTDTSQVIQTVELGGEIGGYSTGVYQHIVISLDFTNEVMQVWFNNVSNGVNYSIANIAIDTQSCIVRLGADEALGSDYNGDMDEFKLMNFAINASQVASLFDTNSIVFAAPSGNGGGGNNGTNVTEVEQTSIITNHTPSEGFSSASPINFGITLNHQATCDLYVDNTFEKEFTDILAQTYQKTMTVGSHNYFWYCEYIENSTLKFELTNVTNFDVLNNPPGTISFSLAGSDFNVAERPLAIVTPCLQEGIRVPLTSGHFPQTIAKNAEGAWFRVLSNGYAQFDLPSGEHEFCLINGLLEFGSLNRTTQYNVNHLYGYLELGTFNVPNNLTSSYSITLDNFDIYDKTNPKAWGTSWVELIGSIIALALGVIILFFGIEGRSPKMVLASVLLIMASLGYQISNIVLAGIF